MYYDHYSTIFYRTLYYYMHTDQHLSMLNLTSRLAIRLRYFPDWEFDWSDNSPQRSRDSLTLEEFLPDEEDAAKFTRLAIEYTMHFLAKEFPCLHSLGNTLPELQPLHPVMKTEAVPQNVLFKDEKYIHETIGIFEQLIIDANLQGDPQVQTTKKCMRNLGTCTEIMYMYYVLYTSL